MATKSILKTIYIKRRNPASRLISALENASGKGEKVVEMSRGCSEASRDEITKIFGVPDDGI